MSQRSDNAVESEDARMTGAFTPHDLPAHYDIHHARYSVEEAASLLGMHPDVIRHAISAGEMHAYRVGHDILYIERTEMVRWLTWRGPGV